MPHPVSEALIKSNRYSAQELALLENALEFKTLEKEDFLLNKGEVCSFISFIVQGALYQYTLDSELNKQVIELNASNEWVLNHQSFTSQKPSECYIQAFENTSIYLLSVESLHALIAQSQSFLQMGRILEESSARVRFFDQNSGPDEKYQYILEERTQLIQKFPQKLIASYLKISPETLSRVRSRLRKS